MITNKQAKLLKRIIVDRRLGSGARHISACSADYRLLLQIEQEHPGSIDWHYGGASIRVGEHSGTVAYNTAPAASRLLDDYDAAAIVGFDGVAEVEDGRGLSERKNFHYRADTEAKLRQAIRRGVAWYHKFEIVELRAMTHAQWVQAYGWGRM